LIIAFGVHHKSINGMHRINYLLLHLLSLGAALGSLPSQTSEPLSPQGLYSFSSVAYVWECGAKTTGPIANKFDFSNLFFSAVRNLKFQ
jgi:hypothetical protein